MGSPLRISNSTKKFSSETNLFLSNSCCQGTSLNMISCLRRALWNKRTVISGKVSIPSKWVCLAASAQSITGSVTQSSISKCVPDGSRGLSKTQTCLGGI